MVWSHVSHIGIVCNVVIFKRIGPCPQLKGLAPKIFGPSQVDSA